MNGKVMIESGFAQYLMGLMGVVMCGWLPTNGIAMCQIGAIVVIQNK